MVFLKNFYISKGKANLIDLIRREFPELSEEELASLTVGDLALMLDETTDDIKGKFKKLDKPVKEGYIGKDEAEEIALAKFELTLDLVEFIKICQIKLL